LDADSSRERKKTKNTFIVWQPHVENEEWLPKELIMKGNGEKKVYNNLFSNVEFSVLRDRIKISAMQPYSSEKS